MLQKINKMSINLEQKMKVLRNLKERLIKKKKRKNSNNKKNRINESKCLNNDQMYYTLYYNCVNKLQMI